MTKNKWTVKIILLIITILAGLVLFINLAKVNYNVAKTDYKGIYSAMLNGNQGSFNWENETGFEINPNELQGNGFYIPKIAGRSIYCTEKNVELARTGNMYREENEAYSYYNSNGTKIVTDIFNPNDVETNGTMWSRILTDEEVKKINNIPEFGLNYTIQTRGYYKCSGEHTSVSAEEAYVITAEPCNQWTPRKQIVIWWLDLTGANGWNNLLETLTDKQKAVAINDRTNIEKLYNEAKAYGKYHKKVEKALANDGQYASNLTDENNITSEYYTSESKEYIKVGPYSMKYVNGRYKNEEIIFGGIGGQENSELLGLYIQNGNQKIKVEKIIVNDNEKNTKYFNPCDENNPNDVSGYYVENTKYSLKPSSEQEFYVLIEKTQLENDAKLYAHFTWMDATGEECVKEGVRYKISTKSIENGKLKLTNGKIKFISKSSQELTEYQGERQLNEYTLELGRVQPPSQEGSYNINIRKTDENGNGLKGATFLINDLTYTSDENGYILRNQQTINDAQEEIWTLEEKSAPTGYIFQPLKIKFKVLKGYNSQTNTWEVTKIEMISSNSNAIVTYSKETKTVTVQIINIKAVPNEPGDLLDSYAINVKKIDEEGNGLEGAKFNITWPTEKESEAVSDESGNLVVLGQIPILGLNSEGVDHFKIEETEAPAEYKKIEGTIEFDVIKEKLITIDGKAKYGITGITNVNAPEGVIIELNGRGEISIIIPNKKDIQLISIGGNVWEDAKTGKASLGDGVNNTSNNADKNLANIKVSLYTENMQLAELMPDDSVTNIYNKINPTLTDENGNYKFEGVDASKNYCVVFEYDGQVYMPTEYLAKGISEDTIQNYNSVEEMLSELVIDTTGKDNGGKDSGLIGQTGQQTASQWLEKWKANSKATEIEISSSNGKNTIEGRENFNERFLEIGASPKNYISKNTLGISTYLVRENDTYYNKSFTRLELMGYTLKKTSKGIGYVQDKIQLVDGYKYNKYGTLDYDDNGAITNEWTEGEISKKIKEFIVENGHYPNEVEKLKIYRNIVSDMDDEEAWNKLQFIEDCKISAITKSPFNNEGIEYYPTDKNIVFEEDLLTNYVNLGLWRRQEFNAQLSKDVLEIKTNSEVIEYNGKNYAISSIKDYMNDYTESKENLAKQYADTQKGIYINRLSPVYYYNKNYNRKISQSEYMSGDLNVEITYRITVYNISQSLESEIMEIVDYYDNSLQLTKVCINTDSQNDLSNSTSLAQNNSRYGEVTEKSFNGFNKAYIRFDNRKLATGECLTIDLTYSVKNMTLKGFEKYINIGEKTNIAEINGYKTYYSANTSLPNRHGTIIGNNTTIAGLIDVNSTPGNLETIDEITNGVVNFEDDSDKTTATLIVDDPEDPENPDNPDTPPDNPENYKIIGCVWDDLNNNGIKDEGENLIYGVKVALCTKESSTSTTGEVQDDWINEYNEWLQKNKLDDNYIYKAVSYYETGYDANEGYYEFEVDSKETKYYVLFKYGDDDKTVLGTKYETYNVLNGEGINSESYNGQDYKSTKFQVNADNNASLDTRNISYAKDDYRRVEEIQEWSKIQTNNKAEILASPTKVPEYQGIKYNKDEMGELISDLKTNTWKIAITPELELGTSKSGNNIYYINLGLTKRPETQLKIENKVKNVKITLADGSIVFDAEQTAEKNEEKNVIWKSNNTNWGFIQLYLDKELMYGATIQIEYEISIKEQENYVDYNDEDYYTKNVEPENKDKVVSKATKLVCYIPKTMQLQDSSWNECNIDELAKENNDTTNLVNNKLNASIESSNMKIITKDIGTNEYKEGSSEITKSLKVSQLITEETLNNNGEYECKVEIIELENAVGRRMKASIVGNYNPNDDPKELDESQAEDVTVMPPFGVGHVFYYVLAIVIAGILVVGIIFIKKRVLVK